MKPLLVLLSVSLVFAQQSVDQAINTIFNTNVSPGGFLEGYEEVTQAPLRSISALAKCGEGEQLNRFVCVPYYNCDPDTNTVIANPDLDGTNIIDVRFGEENSKCDHYLEICCQVANTSTGIINNPPGTTPPTPVTPRPVTPSPVTPRPITPPPSVIPITPEGSGVTPRPPPVQGDQRARFNCGIRNEQGVDVNLVGGSNEAKFGEFPWMVAILRKNPGSGENLAICGGSLIGPRVILTGAHCVKNIDITTIKIRAGEWDTQTTNERIPFQERNVVQKIVHEHYSEGNLYNNVALLILERSFAKADHIGTICLPAQDQLFNSRDCFATGWGKDIFGTQGRYAVFLKKIQLPLVHHKDCQNALTKTRLGASFLLHRSFICAGGEPGVDTCTGDGGSPLVCRDPNNANRYLQVGGVAWGIGCGENRVPGVYVDIGKFRQWIDGRLQELGISSDSYVL